MKGAIASVEIFARDPSGTARRLTLTITAPERGDDGAWSCRVALADLHRPQTVHASDSVTALAGAFAHARRWLDALCADGNTLHRDREGERSFVLS